MSARELDAAGIREPALRSAYELCRQLNARHGRTYYLATLLLPPAKRPFVHALYGFARQADEYVDSATPDPDRLVAWGQQFLHDLDSTPVADVVDPVSRAAVHTARTWDIPRETFVAFLTSMQMDIVVTGYPAYADLEAYMEGSAAMIGLQMVPILEPVDDRASRYARTLGEAFQMSNFVRDVAEDLRRGRVYLPQEDLDRFGVTRTDLAPGPTPSQVRELLAFEVARTRALYKAAEPGIDMLHPSSRDCIRTAFVLYAGILDAVERADYQVLDRRVAVPIRRRLAVALPALVSARRARGAPTRPTS
ncbi:MAG TPA: phytoene/squalene synthase family protein [Actinomycetes bacterium]|nr:phytoene/squalene synthase family protein [Actinomycetes bacterium]